MTDSTAERPSIDGLRRFVRSYAAFTQMLDRLRTGEFTSNFERSKAALQSIQRLRAELQSRDAPDFNVFRVLGVMRHEVTTHSSMLAELLDPSGSHGQGWLFLESFVKSEFVNLPFD